MVVSPQSHLAGGRSQDSLDDAEKGMYDSTVELTAPPPFVYMGPKRAIHIDTTFVSPASPVHEGITPFSSVPELSLSWPAGWRATDASELKATVKKPAPKKPKISRWILFDLWFNTYRKFFTFVTVLNLAGIIMAALGRFPYAENHLGALVLGNLLTAILMRNELWMRFLYLVFIYGLRSVRPLLYTMTSRRQLTRTNSGHHCASSTVRHQFFSMSEAFTQDALYPVPRKASPAI
jgi:hypothetical protein